MDALDGEQSSVDIHKSSMDNPQLLGISEFCIYTGKSMSMSMVRMWRTYQFRSLPHVPWHILIRETIVLLLRGIDTVWQRWVEDSIKRLY